jgi:2-hydroxychromene-2-carboxylate isomerase
MYPAALRAQEVRTITAQVEAAIAARPETPAHNALISALQHLDETSQVDSILKGAGVALKRLADDRKLHSADIDANLARNAAEAWGLGFRGTPGFLIGRQLLPRSLTLQQLQQLTANARAAP